MPRHMRLMRAFAFAIAMPSGAPARPSPWPGALRSKPATVSAI